MEYRCMYRDDMVGRQVAVMDARIDACATDKYLSIREYKTVRTYPTSKLKSFHSSILSTTSWYRYFGTDDYM